MIKRLRAAVGAVAGLALAISLVPGSAAPASAATHCSTSVTSYSTVHRGSHGKNAKAAECLLRKAGQRTSVNGSFSSADARAMKAFQKKTHLKQTGTVDRSGWTALLARGSKRYLKVGNRNGTVKRLQRSLTASGHRVPATGYFGSMTKAAVKSFQRSARLRATGTANASTWTALQAGGKAKHKAPAKKKRAAKKATHKKTTRSTSATKSAKALAFAKKQIGDRYRYGGTGPNAWDCSGLTQGAWKAAGVKLPRTSQTQYRVGKKVSKSNLKPGDLVFFYSGIRHVAIYAGHGNVIHASRPGKPVGTLKMKYMPYKGARRPA